MKQYWKKVKEWWSYAREDNLFLSWLIDIIFAIVLIQFIIFPLLSFSLGTDLPVVAVVSTSMEHDMNRGGGSYFMCGNRYMEDQDVDFDTWWDECGEWYEENSISKTDFESYPFSNGFNEGDVMVIQGKAFEDIEIGQVIVFESEERGVPIIHRVVDRHTNDTLTLQAKGDNNGDSVRSLGEENISESQVKGVAVGRIPFIGYLKLLVSNIFA